MNDRHSTLSVVVSWPSAPLTEALVRKALETLGFPAKITPSIPNSFSNILQWSTYDDIDHELVHRGPSSVLSSSYTIRKALIRKHYLARCIELYVTKHPESRLKNASPRTWCIDISFADELDEMWCDELFDLGNELDNPAKWWILKPGMSDRGMGIRLFNSKETLQRIFEEFEGDSEEEEEEEADPTSVVTSQLRHFIIQVASIDVLASFIHFIVAGIPSQSTLT
jgi:tubulin---tyrosine ligase